MYKGDEMICLLLGNSYLIAGTGRIGDPEQTFPRLDSVLGLFFGRNRS
jgi:hypothetical protein